VGTPTEDTFSVIPPRRGPVAGLEGAAPPLPFIKVKNGCVEKASSNFIRLARMSDHRFLGHY
jgi:hypothetical protein